MKARHIPTFPTKSGIEKQKFNEYVNSEYVTSFEDEELVDMPPKSS